MQTRRTAKHRLDVPGNLNWIDRATSEHITTICAVLGPRVNRRMRLGQQQEHSDSLWLEAVCGSPEYGRACLRTGLR